MLDFEPDSADPSDLPSRREVIAVIVVAVLTSLLCVVAAAIHPW